MTGRSPGGPDERVETAGSERGPGRPAAGRRAGRGAGAASAGRRRGRLRGGGAAIGRLRPGVQLREGDHARRGQADDEPAVADRDQVQWCLRSDRPRLEDAIRSPRWARPGAGPGAGPAGVMKSSARTSAALGDEVEPGRGRRPTIAGAPARCATPEARRHARWRPGWRRRRRERAASRPGQRPAAARPRDRGATAARAPADAPSDPLGPWRAGVVRARRRVRHAQRPTARCRRWRETISVIRTPKFSSTTTTSPWRSGGR